MADGATLGLLRVILTANTAEFDDALKKASKTADDWGKDLGKIGQQATALGSTLTKAITLPLAGLAVGAVKMASDFESSFAGVRKTVDATEPEFAQLAQGLRNMAKEIPVNVNELNKVAEAAGQLGIKKEDILQFTRTMADLGVTTNLTADEAATATAQIQNIFGAAGKDVDRFGATLVALGNAGASTEKDIIEMSLRIAGAGTQVGLTQAEVLAFASSLSSVGINAEAGGSAISRVFLKINDAVAKGGDSMNEFARVAGMSGAEFSKAFKDDAASATVAFIEGLARLKGEGENVNATLEGMVGKNIILKDTLMRASGAGQLLREQLALGDKAWKDNAALVKEAEERYKTFESQVTLLWNQLKDVGITIGQSLIPVLKDLMVVMQPVLHMVAATADGFAKLPEPIRLVVIGIAALAASIGPVLWAFGQLASGAATVIGAFGAKGIATRALTAIMGASAAQAGVFSMALSTLGTTAAVAAAAFAGWKLGGWLGEITGATDGVGKLSAKIGEMIGLLPAGTAAQYDASRAAAEATKSSTGLAQAQTAAATSHAEVAKTASAAVAPIRRMAEATEESGKKAKDATKEYREYMNWIGERQMEAAGILVQAMDKVAASFQRGLAAMVPFKAAVKSTADEMRALGGAITDLVSTSLYEYGVASTKARKEAEEWAQKNGAVLAPSIEAVGTKFEEVAIKVETTWSKMMDGLPGVIMGAIQGGGSVISAVGSHIGTSLMKGFADKFGPAIKAALPFGIGNAVVALLPTIGALFGPIAKKIGDFFKRMFGGPSGDELAGREAVAGFEDALSDTLTAQQKAEAGGEAWKKTVIAIRDAYIAMGRTEEEALADAKRLWESSKDGAEAAQRVIEEIQRKMRELTGQTHDIDVEVHYRAAPTPGQTRPGEPENHTMPVDDGFATGTMGRFGRFFQNFGAGMTTRLHGVEAVLRPQDALPFARSVLAGLTPGEPQAAGVSSSINVLPVLMGSGMSPRDIGREAARYLAGSGLPNDESGITSAIESVVENWLRTYARA